MARPDARVFVALSDPLRLALLDRVRRHPRCTTSSLVQGTGITRQGVTKHLDVLAEAGLVHDAKEGRERLWTADPKPLDELSAWLTAWRREWTDRFDRLERHLQEQEHPKKTEKKR